MTARSPHTRVVRHAGKIARLFPDKGFGFISRDHSERGEDLFFHRSAVVSGTFSELDVGQAVTYIVGQGAKGPRAEAVEVVDEYENAPH